MHWTSLFVCVCGIIAKGSPDIIGREQIIFPRENQGELKSYIHPGYLARTISEYTYQLRPNTEKWEAPDYRKAYENYILATYDLEKFIVPKLDRKDKTRINTIAIWYAFEMMSKQLVINGWSSISFYAAKLRVTAGRGDPQMALNVLNCYMDEYRIRTNRIRLVLANKWVQFVCTAKESACNPTIYTIVKMTEIDEEAKLLLLLGKVASLYTNSFAQGIQKFAQADPTKYFDVLKDKVKPLVIVNADVQKHIFNGTDYCSIRNKPFT